MLQFIPSFPSIWDKVYLTIWKLFNRPGTLRKYTGVAYLVLPDYKMFQIINKNISGSLYSIKGMAACSKPDKRKITKNELLLLAVREKREEVREQLKILLKSML